VTGYVDDFPAGPPRDEPGDGGRPGWYIGTDEYDARLRAGHEELLRGLRERRAARQALPVAPGNGGRRHDLARGAVQPGGLRGSAGPQGGVGQGGGQGERQGGGQGEDQEPPAG
jgi:hypothetical protein